MMIQIPGLIVRLCLGVGLFLTTFQAIAGDASNVPGIYLEGQLIVSKPQMNDARFENSVIFMLRHNKKGAMGLVINRPMGVLPLDEFLEKSGVEAVSAMQEMTLFYGGPVEPEEGFVLHSHEYKIEATRQINEEFFITREREILEDISIGEGPNKHIIIMGYAGWAPGQLEQEFRQGSWTATQATPEIVFGVDHATKWQRARSRSGLPL